MLFRSRSGRDDDALLTLTCHPQGGQQIRQRLASARAGLDDQVPLLLKRLLNRPSHVILAASVLEGQ